MVGGRRVVVVYERAWLPPVDAKLPHCADIIIV